MIYNQYQESLAERSMVVEPNGDGEIWSFRWYADPIAKGLADWKQYTAHVSDGYITFHGMTMPRNEAEMVEMDRAMQFVKARYERVGLDEQNQESGN